LIILTLQISLSSNCRFSIMFLIEIDHFEPPELIELEL
jgi:hypothetical protein